MKEFFGIVITVTFMIFVIRIYPAVEYWGIKLIDNFFEWLKEKYK